MPDAEVSRRSFLDTLLFTSLAAAGVTALTPIPFFLRPPPPVRPPRVRVSLNDLERSPATNFQYGGRGATVLMTGGDEMTIRVIDRHCTHQGCDVTLNAQKWQFECPCHGAIFSPDGTPIRGPHNGPLASIPWRIVEGDLEVGE